MGKKLLGVTLALFFCMTACAFQSKATVLTLTEEGKPVLEYSVSPNFKARLKFRLKYRGDAQKYAEKEDIRELIGNFTEEAEKVYAAREFRETEPKVQFDSGKFTYTEGSCGVCVNRESTLKGILSGYHLGKNCVVEIKKETLTPKETVESVKARTKLMGEFTTVYESSSSERKENVKIAANRLNNFCIGVGEKLSFNAVVGNRTEENGFRKAPVIEYGQYTDGVGGGVCQVSTTLYNAALKAGLKVEKVQHHSLPVHYVPPSFDAMVSEYSDLILENDTPFPVYLWTEADGQELKAHFYGLPKYGQNTVKLVSVVLEELETEEYERRETEGITEETVLRPPKKGLISEGFVEVYRDGVLISRTKVRKDKYLTQKGIILVPKENPDEKEPAA